MVVGYVVVLLTGSKCPEYPDVTCVMEAKGPYQTREDANLAAKRQPDWTTPHIMLLRGPDD